MEDQKRGGDVDPNESKIEVAELGRESFRTGDWFPRLVAKSYRNYCERANAAYFKSKYPARDREYIARKLTSVAARNAALLGAGTGLAISADEIVGLVTAGEGGVGIPANVAIAVAGVLAEAVGLVKIQMKLVANLAELYEVPLDPDDPEDILIIIAFALGGSAADAAGKAGMRIGGRLAERAIRRHARSEVLAAIKKVGRKIGVKMLQRTIVKYAVPIVSVGIGGGWNYASTKSVGKIALRHMSERRKESEESPPPGGAAT